MCCFLGLGVRTIYIWHVGKAEDANYGMQDYANNYGAGLAMGSLR